MRTTRLSVVKAHGALLPVYASALVNYNPSLFIGTPCSTPRHGLTRTPQTRSVGVRIKSSLSGWDSPVDEDVSVLQLPAVEAPDVAVIWFTSSDLRVHDHDGLIASAAAAAVLPVYVFDDQELAAESPLDAAFTYHAVQELRNTLRILGSDLVVRSGDVGKEISRLVEQAGASQVFFHESPVHSLRQSHDRVKASLASLELGVDPLPAVQLSSWSAAQLAGVEENDPTGAWNFRDFETSAAGGRPVRSAFPVPASLPPLPSNIVAGDLPALDDVISRVGSTDKRVKKALSDASLEEPPFGVSRLCVEGYGESWALRTLDDYLSMDEEDFARSVFGPEDVSEESAETGLEAAATRRIVRARGYRGLAPGEALARAMGVALALGCISPRRMFRARRTAGDGVLGVLRRRASGKCWAKELAMRESWHFLLALRDVTIGNDSRDAMEQRYLRWHGWLVRYAVGGSLNPADPAALLVHGFGASSDQWDRVFEEFATGSPASSSQRRLRLVALDLIGFGHSAKPPLTYSQYSWADCARDVALRVGEGPFFVAGNSIGGYISMGLAAECRELCQGVVLVNSAGRILTPEDFEAEVTRTYDGLNVESATRRGKLGAYSAPPNAALVVLGTGLFAFLQGRIAKICRNLYPVNPELVDQGLAENILRDSCDPGAVGVIAAGGKLPFSRSANEMLQKFGRPVLVTQGVKDPLNDAEGRATSFQALGPQVEVVRLDGGHCPHHEVAEEVSKAMYGFIERVQAEKERVVLHPGGVIP